MVTDTLDSTAAGARPELVIFDLDGTLTDSAHGIVSSFRHALEQAQDDRLPIGDRRGEDHHDAALPYGR